MKKGRKNPQNFYFIRLIWNAIRQSERQVYRQVYFLKELQKYLKASPYNIDSKLMIRGLGEASLVLGEK